MKPKNYEVLMDIYMGVLNAPAIQFTTEDFGMCQITFSLLEDRITPYNLSNCIVRMVINGQQQDCTISDANNGKAEIVLLQSMFTEVGFVTAELQIYDATNQTMRLTTPTFKYTVRKSLMDDNTVQADANYSILQQMILNVSNADKVSSEALKLSKEAKAICDDLVPKANTAAQNAQTALDRAESVVTQEELAQKVMLGGAPQTKFDFIKNQVMKDGLIGSAFCIKTTTTVSCPSLDAKNGTIIVNADFENISFLFDAGLFTLRKKLEWNRYQLSTNPTNPLVETVYGHKCFIVVSLLDGILSMSQTINGVTEIKKCDLKTEGIINSLSMFYGSKLNDASVLVYNRQLTTQEIQHIFQVLNNPESIKELRTTDSEGKTSILKLGSNSTHVEMQTGRTLEEEYTSLLGRFGKEIDSPDGSAVQVDNGLSGKVLKMSIKGQTVKNYVETNTEKVIRAGGATSAKYKFSNIEVGKTYTLSFELFDSTDESSSIMFSLNNGNTNFSTVKCSNGIKTIEITPESQNLKTELWFYFQNTNTNTAKIRNVMIVDSSNKNIVTSYIPFGLSSTEAIISNNGQQYPIYATEEDKANKKVILCSGVDGVSDTLALNENGSVIYTKLFNADSNIEVQGMSSDSVQWVNIWKKSDALSKSNSVSEKILFEKYSDEVDTTRNHNLYGLKFPLNTFATLEDAQNYFNGSKFIYQLKTPTVTAIDKSIIPTILTHKTNILEVGGAVKPSSFKVTVPVDRLAEIEARLQALESTTVDVVLNK